MMRYFITLSALLFYLFFNVTGQTGIIKGKIVDSSTNEPLAGVYVIYGKNLGTTGDSTGSYFIRSEAGRLTITFRIIGYEPVIKEVVLKPDEIIDLNVSMQQKALAIDQVVISASRTEQKVSELTVSMDVVKSEFLSENHITDAAEVINRTPGIEVLDGQASIRGGSGFSYGAGSRVLALIDGLPYLSADAGNIKWQFLPLESLSQIEIIKGASSVLYGSSALNGIINFRTAEATNIPQTQFFAEAGVYGNPGNRDWKWWARPRMFSGGSFSHLRKSGKTDIGISGNILIDEGYRKLNDERLGRISFKLKHFSKKVEGLNYGLNLHTGYDEKRDFVLWEDATTGALKQSPSTAVEYHGTFVAIDPFISLKNGRHFQHDLKVRLQSTLSRLPESKQNNSDAYSLYSEYQLLYKISDIFDLTTGLSDNYSLVNSNFFGDHHCLNIAGFAQLAIKPAQKLKVVAGMRAEKFSIDGKFDKTVPIFRAGINWQVAHYTFLRASFGQGYRYPSMAEKYATTTLGSIRIIPNPSILPESGWSAETGIKQGIGSGNITGQADLSIFFLQNKNLIEYMFGLYSEGLGFRAANVEQARIYGTEIEFLLSGSAGNVKTTLSGGYTFIYPIEFSETTKRNTHTYLKYRRKHSATVAVNNQWKKIDLIMTLFIKSKILNIDDVFLTTPILPGFSEYWAGHNTGYITLDATAGYKITENFTLSLAVKNLTNTEYMGRPGDIQPQRNFSLRISGKF